MTNQTLEDCKIKKLTPRKDYTGARIILGCVAVFTIGMILSFKITCIVVLVLALILAVLVLTH
jgi:hypothetical protein